jgi:hypothetical protein
MNLQRKCSSTFFKKGNTPWIKGRKIPQASSAAEVEEARPVLRMGLAEFSLVTKTGLDGSSLSTPDCEGRSGNVRLLRPSAATRLADLKDTSFEGTRLVDNARMISTFNQATEHHRRVSPSCLEHLRIADEVKFRLGVEGDTGVCHMQDYHTPIQAVQGIGDQKTRPEPSSRQRWSRYRSARHANGQHESPDPTDEHEHPPSSQEQHAANIQQSCAAGHPAE